MAQFVTIDCTSMLVTLTFINRTAGENGATEVVKMQISRDAVEIVMDWYGAFCAGDDYDVLVNGRKVRHAAMLP